jgi:hypothetical protein
VSPDGLLAAGTNLLAARAGDRGGETFLDLEVTANLPPDCASITTDPTTLWPPNHELHTITARGGIDPEGDAVTLAVTSVTQDEPLDDHGDGTTIADADRAGSSTDKVRVRAERSGIGDGRVYRLNVVATDAAGASCSTMVSIGVPHDEHRASVDTVTVDVDSFGSSPSSLDVANVDSRISVPDGPNEPNEAPVRDAPPMQPDPAVAFGAASPPDAITAATPPTPTSTVPTPFPAAAEPPELTGASMPNPKDDNEKMQKSETSRQHPSAPSAHPKSGRNVG